MDYKVLYRKYRPKDFDSVYGQNYTIKILQNSVINNKISHAYLFTGPRGTGKTSTAKIFANAINCLEPVNGNPCGKCQSCLDANSPDIIELDAASNNGVEEIRNIIDSVRLAPSFAKYKVYIIDEVHMLTQNAFNALLLTLEEPPGHVVFILATTDVQKVPITIISRCQRFDFKPIDSDSIFERLKFVTKEENIDVSDDALKEISYIANGGLRDALSILDQLSCTGTKITLDEVYSSFGAVSSVKIKKLASSFVNDDINEIIVLIKEFKDNGINYVVLIEKLIEELRNIAIDIKCNGKVEGNFDNIFDLIVELNKCLNSSNINLNPYVLIELVILKYINRESQMMLYDFSKNEKTDSIELKEESQDDIREKNISREIIEEDKCSNNDSSPNEIESAPFDEKLISIRINNCFFGATKELKKEMNELWPEFLEYIDENFKSIISIVVDTSIGMASNDYSVIIAKNLSTAELVNNKISLISDIFEELYNKKMKFVCLSEEDWQKEMDLYISDKKNGKKYEFIEELTTTELSSKNEIDKIATDLFDEDVVEYE